MANNQDEYDEAETLALRALAWVVRDERLGPRFLALTGMDATELRTRAGEAATLSAVIAFLEDHEPDLVACAEALDIRPEVMVKARAVLTRGVPAS